MPDLNDNVAGAKATEQNSPGMGSVPQKQSAPAQFEVGTYVTFGRYPQNNGETPEPIEWLVLDNDGKTALLLSKFGLDCRPFHHEEASLSWRDCDLRQWLNRDFLNLAFTAEEQGNIIESPVFTDDNPYSGNKGCGLTHDKIFCLSIEEVYKYFGNAEKRNGFTEDRCSEILNSIIWVSRDPACQPSAYAISQGASQGKFFHKDEIKDKPSEWWFDNCWFWLRSPGWYAIYAPGVTSYGLVNHRGNLLDLGDRAVRPALRIKLSNFFDGAAEDREISGKQEICSGHETAGERTSAYWQKYELPPLSLLNDGNLRASSCAEDKSEVLLSVLRRFNLEARLCSILHGPAVTRYDIEPDYKNWWGAGQLAALQDDIALALGTSASQMRIKDDFDGPFTGIEVPCDFPEQVTLKDILTSDSFSYGLGLRICLGKDIAGRAIAADLVTMPHLLIAANAGSEKSVCLHSIILSLLYKFTPDKLQFLIIGDRESDLSAYEGVPHLAGNASNEAGHIITSSIKAEIALRQAVQLMINRYKLIAASNAHNIDEYNAKNKNCLPRVVIIIEELSYLMTCAPPHKIEKSICCLAQNAHVVGIHLVIATRNPSEYVITSPMRKQIPARISFAASSEDDPSVIFDDGSDMHQPDDSGSERLLGNGDMLVSSMNSLLKETERIQGAFVTNEEVGRVADFWRSQAVPGNKIELNIFEPKAEPFDPAKLEMIPVYALSAQARFERGTYVTFGRYPQKIFDMPEPIEWLVLDNDGETALLISKYGLDGREFHNVFPDAAGWSSCSLREWLNIDFLRKAFNDDERQRITESILHNDDTVFEDWDGLIKVTKGCSKTRDKIFCLSIDEAEHYFADNVSRMCVATQYAKKRARKSVRARIKQKRGLITEPSLSVVTANTYGLYIQVPVDIDSCCYWLRSQGDCEDSIARVYYDGSIHMAGSDIYEETEAVRPALRIKL
ncbi:MAG: DUF6273 domain-containing protein [bacterium]|nr:DUF6273 domain-containing protein [bacterium]